EMAPHTPGSGRVHRPELERRIAHEAAPAIGVAADQAEHPIEEPPDLGRGGPGLLERRDHRIHDGLPVALTGPQEEVAVAPEGGGARAIAQSTTSTTQEVLARRSPARLSLCVAPRVSHPTRHPHSSAVEPIMSSSTSSEGPSPREPLRILMVEDVAADAELMLRELRRAGVRCATQRVESGTDLRRALHEFAPDIVLADHALPQFSALDAPHLLRHQ